MLCRQNTRFESRFALSGQSGCGRGREMYAISRAGTRRGSDGSLLHLWRIKAAWTRGWRRTAAVQKIQEQLGGMHSILGGNGVQERQGLRRLWRTELRFSAAALRSVARRRGGRFICGKKIIPQFFTAICRQNAHFGNGWISLCKARRRACTNILGGNGGGSDGACDIFNGV